MRQVYRFEIDIDEIQETKGLFTLELPINSVPLHVATQQRAPHKPSMWILVDVEEKRTVQKEFLLVGTAAQGHEPPPGKSQYIGTFQDIGFVWHVFER